jgi:hypothetical protein
MHGTARCCGVWNRRDFQGSRSLQVRTQRGQCKSDKISGTLGKVKAHTYVLLNRIFLALALILTLPIVLELHLVLALILVLLHVLMLVIIAVHLYMWHDDFTSSMTSPTPTLSPVSLRLIDTEAAAISSSTHLLWSMGGRERESQGSKCIAGLQIISCARVDSSDASSSSSGIGSGDSRGGRGSYGTNDSDSSRGNSEGVDCNKMGGTGTNNFTREISSSSSSNSNSSSNSSGSIGSKREHILIFKRIPKYFEDDVGEKFNLGDRVIISLEKENLPQRPQRGFIKPDMKQKIERNHSTLSVDIEDLGSVNPHSRISSGSDAGVGSGDVSESRLVEPNVVTGQILKLAPTAVHITLKERPRRLLRYAQCRIYIW